MSDDQPASGETTTDLSGGEVTTDLSGGEVTTDLSGGYPFGQFTPPPPPPPISLEDILNATEVLRQKEAVDKAAIETIGALTFESLRAKLIQWGVAGFPNSYPILTIPISTPPVCSDGVQRTLGDYIEFCSGKSIQDHIQGLQDKMTGIAVAFSKVGESVVIVVTKE